MGTVSGVVSPSAATLKGFGLKQVNVRVVTNHSFCYMLERNRARAAGEGRRGRGRPRPQGAAQADIGAQPRTFSSRISR